jgi:hypothetical protein
MKTIKYNEITFHFPENMEENPPAHQGEQVKIVKDDWPENDILLRLSGEHIGSPIEVWIIGVYEDVDGDESCTSLSWHYKELRWPDLTLLSDEASQYIGDYYEDSIKECITPCE